MPLIISSYVSYDAHNFFANIHLRKTQSLIEESKLHHILLQLLIDGKFVDALSGKKFSTEDPRTGAKIIEIAEAQAEDVDAAVKAARKVNSILYIQ